MGLAPTNRGLHRHDNRFRRVVQCYVLLNFNIHEVPVMLLILDRSSSRAWVNDHFDRILHVKLLIEVRKGGRLLNIHSSFQLLPDCR